MLELEYFPLYLHCPHQKEGWSWSLCPKSCTKWDVRTMSNTKSLERHLPAHAGKQAVLNHNSIVALLLVLSSRAILHTVTDPQAVKAKRCCPTTTTTTTTGAAWEVTLYFDRAWCWWWRWAWWWWWRWGSRRCWCCCSTRSLHPVNSEPSVPWVVTWAGQEDQLPAASVCWSSRLDWK